MLAYVLQFIRITDNTSMEKLQTLLFDLWQMPKPGLVLTFYGTDPSMSSLQKLLQTCLGQITKQTSNYSAIDNLKTIFVSQINTCAFFRDLDCDGREGEGCW